MQFKVVGPIAKHPGMSEYKWTLEMTHVAQTRRPIAGRLDKGMAIVEGIGDLVLMIITTDC
jgi:hypothetical protein